MSDYAMLGVSFAMMIACAIGINGINKGGKEKAKTDKRILILLLIISIGGIIFSGYKIAKSKGAINMAKAKYNAYKAARAGPATPVVPAPGPAPAAGTPAANLQPNPVTPAV